MIWTKRAYNLHESGEYAVTAHMDAGRVPFFIAYWKQHILSGSCATAGEAKAVCAEHNRGRQ